MSYNLDEIKVLVVDDMKPMLSLTAATLESFGFKEVYKARDGKEGFELFCRHDPDLVITDWIMDPVDGLEMTKMIRNHPMSPNRFAPVIMMTGFSAKARVELSRDSGITEFLVKPFNAGDLYRRIFQIIEKPRQFVNMDGFFGPDRRRRDPSGYQGPKRRDDDGSEIAASPEHTGILKKLQQEAKEL